MVKINSQRLNRYIMSRDACNSSKSMLELYDSLSVEQRLEIKNLLQANKQNGTCVNNEL